MTTPSKPTILFVPGAWHTSAGFAPSCTHLQTLGFPTATIDHRTIGGTDPSATIHDDIFHLRKSLISLIESGKEVVIVCHSWGGIVTSEAVVGLGVAARKAAGQQGGVKLVIYLAAFSVEKGTSLLDNIIKYPYWINVSTPYTTVSSAPQIFYHDLPPADQAYWTSQLLPIITSVTTHKQSVPTPPHQESPIPAAYIFCKDDMALPYAAQLKMSQNLKNLKTGSEGEGVKSWTLEGSHSSFLARVKEFCDTVVEAIESTEEK